MAECLRSEQEKNLRKLKLYWNNLFEADDGNDRATNHDNHSNHEHRVKDFVLTGARRNQPIANLIIECFSHDETVLSNIHTINFL